MRSELKHVLWWSHAAAERLSEFCKLNNIRRCVERKITKNSSIVYPAEEVLISSRKNVEGSKRKSILAVFSENTLSRKGGDVVLELFTGLDEIGYSNWGLVIYGDFSQCFIDSYSEYTNIKFRQKVGLDALQTEMVRSDIFVFLSKMDTFGTVLIQAINSGQFILTIESIYALALNEVLSVYPNYLSLGNYTSLDLDSKINVLKNFLNKEIKFNNSFRSPFTLKIMRKQLLNIINLIYE